MYYRYKKNKGSGTLIKLFLLVFFIVGGVYLANRYNEYLFFWKYTINQISGEVIRSASIEDQKKQVDILSKALGKSSAYVEDNPLSKEAFFVHAQTLTRLAEAEADVDFTSYVLSGDVNPFSARSKSLLFDALKALKKGIALDERQVIPDALLVLAAKLLFYTGYASQEAIYYYIEGVALPASLAGVEDRRFYGLMLILKGDVDAGVSYLKERGRVVSFEDKLFLSSAYKRAGQYTDAIVSYKELLADQKSSKYEAFIRYNLGEIYFEQSLFNEALEELLKLQLLTPDDKKVHRLIGEVYVKLGDKKSAEAYLKSADS
ncbi:MAG: tetratricopeptide repeat protein [Spirochaetes bacterium]|jgi:tetratricopeptide (TPR) repeat protein|nr:tetratricopeptide repeat protein [Spirochaetota bacterium]